MDNLYDMSLLFVLALLKNASLKKDEWSFASLPTGNPILKNSKFSRHWCKAFWLRADLIFKF
jgi:hypothetical protein